MMRLMICIFHHMCKFHFRWVDLKSQLNMQWNQSFNEYFKPSDVNTGWSTPPQEITATIILINLIIGNLKNTLTYEKTIEKHSIIGLIGYTMEHYNSYSSNLSGGKFPSDEIKTLTRPKNIREDQMNPIGHFYLQFFD